MKTFSAALARVLPALLTALLLGACGQMPAPMSGASAAPDFRVDPLWPQPLPEQAGVQQLFGQVAGIAVDPRNGHIWAVHRPASLLADEYDAKSSKPVTHRSSVPMPARRSPTAPMAGEFKWIHNLAIDGEGNLYTSEVGFGRRVQRFVLGGAGF